MVHFFFPLSAARRRKAISALLEGKPLQIGQCSLYPEDGVIWGVDPYGCDALPSGSINPSGAQKAIEWVERMHVDEHPAEKAY